MLNYVTFPKNFLRLELRFINNAGLRFAKLYYRSVLFKQFLIVKVPVKDTRVLMLVNLNPGFQQTT
jgi:hypothetical protein